jgi:hypothetical protein
MYHQARVSMFRKSVTIWLLLVSLCLSQQPIRAADSFEINRTINGSAQINAISSTYPLVPHHSKLKRKPDLAQIYQLDRQPLGDRKPLLMVHGLRGEYRTCFRWGKVVKRLGDYADFVNTYKVYFLRWDSTGALHNTVPQFKNAVLALQKESGMKPVTVIALSLGGSLTNVAMHDPETDQAIRLVLSLASPFHGSPLFCSDWFQYSLYKNLSYPWTKVDHSIAYRLYFAMNRQLLVDLKWDNSDGLIPNVGRFRSRLLLGPAGDLRVDKDANAGLAQLNNVEKVDKTKFITYAGYLLNPYIQPAFRRQIENTILAPYTLLTMKVPAHLAMEHPVLRMLNHEISRVIPAPDGPRPANWPHMYGLNDGICPVNSALFLPAQACKEYPLCSESELSKIKDLIDVKQARVFRNIDHLTFVDGYSPRIGSHLLRDELNPDDGSRTIFDWILSDLMQAEGPGGTLAKDSSTKSQEARN